MKVLICNNEPDCAGVGYRWAEAGRLAGHDVHSVANGKNIFDYPQDWLWSENAEEIADFHPDLYVLTNSVRVCVELLGHTPRNAMVLCHGSDIRYGTRPNYKRGEREFFYENRWPVYVSTLDLEWLVPDTEWLPTAAAPVPSLIPHEGFVVSHAPSNRKFKGTQALLTAAQIERVDLDIIESAPNAEALARKAASDVFFDQLYWGFGVNAVEAFSMGLPVIAGSHNPAINAYIRSRIEVPHYEVSTVGDITWALQLLREPEERAGLAKRGLEYVAQYHAPEVVAANLDRIWGRLC